MTEERKIYMEKKNEVHTHEEILAAFEDNTVICFRISRFGTPSTKANLFGRIWQINPEAIIVEADLCVMSTEPTAEHKQFLLIDKGGDKTSGNKILDLMFNTGVIPTCYVSFKEKKSGIKRCVLQEFNNKTKVVKKMNLLVDGNDLLVTVRHLNQTDRESKESSET